MQFFVIYSPCQNMHFCSTHEKNIDQLFFMFLLFLLRLKPVFFYTKFLRYPSTRKAVFLCISMQKTNRPHSPNSHRSPSNSHAPFPPSKNSTLIKILVFFSDSFGQSFFCSFEDSYEHLCRRYIFYAEPKKSVKNQYVHCDELYA